MVLLFGGQKQVQAEKKEHTLEAKSRVWRSNTEREGLKA